MKTIVIGMHGFGTNRSKEFIPLKLKCIKENIEFKTFDLFDLSDNDSDYHKWIYKADKVVRKYIDNNYNVILVGFSMGGVIASFLATYLNISQLILISPAFYVIDTDSNINMYNKIKDMDNHNKIKYINKDKPSIKYLANFINLISKLRQSIILVKCPITLIYGTKDEIVPNKSINHIKINYKYNIEYYSINGGEHELHLTGRYVNKVLNIITNCINICINNNSKKENKNEIMQ